ncbi:zinc finger protein 181-like isoform X6 [Liolophura sinensis]|uniref:zinc finger protein 181-like isoform X6 n=1 Tax=Liolophura sinensis TaxID=3198878 RepID=UPI0031590DCB
MDAILERVQNKFACIIGELCSEPVVLSKFAIWLDLRLAEYKAKGAISLDCSGESPDPVWLKGHEVHSPVITRTDDAYSPQSLSRTALPGSKSYQKTRPPEPVVYEENQPDDRLSPGVVVIKEEVTEDDQDVFPISIHRVQPSNQNARKRPLPDSLSRSRDSFSNSSPSKMRHIEDTSISETDNQSLMSIIQDSDPDDHHSTSMTDNDFRTLISSHQPGSATQSRGDNSLAFSPQASSTAAHYSSSPSVSTEDSSSIQHVMSFQSPPGEQSLSQDTGHGADPPRKTTSRICFVCQKVFTRPDSLTRHLRLHQANPKPFSCQYCGAKFSRKEYARNHLARCVKRKDMGAEIPE